MNPCQLHGAGHVACSKNCEQSGAVPVGVAGDADASGVAVGSTVVLGPAELLGPVLPTVVSVPWDVWDARSQNLRTMGTGTRVLNTDHSAAQRSALYRVTSAVGSVNRCYATGGTVTVPVHCVWGTHPKPPKSAQAQYPDPSQSACSR